MAGTGGGVQRDRRTDGRRPARRAASEGGSGGALTRRATDRQDGIEEGDLAGLEIVFRSDDHQVSRHDQILQDPAAMTQVIHRGAHVRADRLADDFGTSGAHQRFDVRRDAVGDVPDVPGLGIEAGLDGAHGGDHGSAARVPHDDDEAGAELRAANSMEPTTEGATMFPAIRTTKRSPNPWSKRISTGVRESEQPDTIANRRWSRTASAGSRARSVSGGIAEATVSFRGAVPSLHERRGIRSASRAAWAGIYSKTRSGSVIIAPCSNRSPPASPSATAIAARSSSWPWATRSACRSRAGRARRSRRRYPGGVREIDALEMTLPWDDDLARAVIVAEAILEHDTLGSDDLAARLVDEYESNGRGMGSQTRAVLNALRHGMLPSRPRGSSGSGARATRPETARSCAAPRSPCGGGWTPWRSAPRAKRSA